MINHATVADLSLLKQDPEWFLNGTFKVCPLMFVQLYSIHVKLFDGNVVPVVFALLPDKSAKSYSRFVDVIIEAIDGFDPQALQVDFEVAMIKTLE